MRIGEYDSRPFGKNPKSMFTPPTPTSYIWIVFYKLSEDSEFNYLASFANELDACEYRDRCVWSHLRPYVSRQPVYGTVATDDDYDPTPGGKDDPYYDGHTGYEG